MRRLIIGIIVTIVLWQYVGILSDDWYPIYRPTDFIDTLTEILRTFFNWLGQLWAHLCSFWNRLDFKDLRTAFLELGIAGKDFICSCLHFFTGYWEIYNGFEPADRILIDFGLGTLIVIQMAICHYYHDRFPALTFCFFGFSMIQSLLIMINLASDLKIPNHR